MPGQVCSRGLQSAFGFAKLCIQRIRTRAKARDSLENVSGNSLTMGPLKTQLYSNWSYQRFDCFFEANRAEDVGSVLVSLSCSSAFGPRATIRGSKKRPDQTT